MSIYIYDHDDIISPHIWQTKETADKHCQS